MPIPGLVLAVVLALFTHALGARAQPVPAYPMVATALHARTLTQRELALDLELARVQRNTRLYLLSWSAANTALAAAQVGIALSSDNPTIRSNYLVGAGLSAAGLGMLLLGYSWPGFDAHKRFRRRVAAGSSQRAARVAYGEELVASQRMEDQSAGTPLKHCFSVAVAAASGVRAGFSFDGVWQGLARGSFVLFVLEMQILTRPGQLFAPQPDRKRASSVSIVVAPWLQRHGAGMGALGRF